MPVVAIFTTIWANPKPAVLFLLHGIKKVLADLHRTNKLPKMLSYSTTVCRQSTQGTSVNELPTDDKKKQL